MTLGDLLENTQALIEEHGKDIEVFLASDDSVPVLEFLHDEGEEPVIVIG